MKNIRAKVCSKHPSILLLFSFDSSIKFIFIIYTGFLFTGLEILAFPCNQFGSQEPGTNEEIVQFACTRFKAEYPIFDKVRFMLKACLFIIHF